MPEALAELKVKAASGIKYPLEGYPNKYITDECEQSVPDTAYYRKALMDGDLVLADALVPAASAMPAASEAPPTNKAK